MDSHPNIDLFNPEELRAEVLKWQERVPKLAAALRERTDELAQARDTIRELQRAVPQGQTPQTAESGDVDARVRARDEMIVELEAKVDEANGRYREAAGQLNHLQMDVSAALADAESWKRKWQSVTQTLDTAVAEKETVLAQVQDHKVSYDAKQAQLEAHHAELIGQKDAAFDALKVRNAKLIETTELANKQMEALGNELKQLMEQAEADLEQATTLRAELDASTAKLDDEQQRNAQLSEQLSALRDEAQAHTEKVTQAEERCTAAEEQLGHAQRNAESAQINASQLRSRVENLEDDLGRAQAQVHTLEAQLEASSTDAEKAAQLQAKLDDVQANLEQAQQRQQQSEKHALALKNGATAQTAQIRSLNKKLSACEARSAQLESTQAELESTQSELEGAQAELASATAQVAQARDALEALREEYATLQSALADKDQQLRREIDEAKRQRDLVEQHAEEIEHLNACIATAQSTTQNKEKQSSVMSARVAELERARRQLEGDLEKRADALRELEQQHAVVTQRQQEDAQLKEEVTGLRKNLAKFQDLAAEREDALVSQQQEFKRSNLASIDELTAAQTTIDDLLVRNEELEDNLCAHEDMLDALARQVRDQESQLEENALELRRVNALFNEAQAQAEQGDAAVVSQEDTESGDEVAQLKLALRHRSEELDKLRWRLQQGNRHSGGDMVMVLSQQLEDARQENARLVARLNQADKAASETLAQETALPQDLTEIKGIGEVLAAALADLGIATFAQVAQLDVAAIAAEDHPLHPYLSRIQRDDWIAQARQLAQP